MNEDIIKEALEEYTLYALINIDTFREQFIKRKVYDYNIDKTIKWSKTLIKCLEELQRINNKKG